MRGVDDGGRKLAPAAIRPPASSITRSANRAAGTDTRKPEAWPRFATVLLLSPCVRRGAEVARNVGANALAHLGRDGRLIQQSQQAVARDQAAARQFAGEDRVLLAAGDILGDRKIVRIQAQPLYAEVSP